MILADSAAARLIPTARIITALPAPPTCQLETPSPSQVASPPFRLPPTPRIPPPNGRKSRASGEPILTPACFTASRTRSGRLRTSPPFAISCSSQRKYQPMAAPHCSICQLSRGLVRTCSFQKRSHAARPGESCLFS